ncbi:MAG: hypothetical protein SGPRY_013978, partial [Prymnesium sp.]
LAASSKGRLTEMGRHKSTLRDLGWSACNSPNPWKQGSAKRVVRTLDYSHVEVDPAKDRAPPEAPVQADRDWEDRLQQLQHDGRQQLDRIREQFEEQDAENRRKLDRLNGRIAELGENKQAMWTVLRQHHLKAKGEADASSGKSSGGVGAGESTNTSKPAHVDISVDTTALNDRENALRAAENSFANEVNAQNESIAMREATLAQKESAVEKAMADISLKEADAREAMLAAEAKSREATARDESFREREAALAHAQEDVSRREARLGEREARLSEREAKLSECETSVHSREQALALAESSVETRQLAVSAAEAALQLRQQQLAEAIARAKMDGVVCEGKVEESRAAAAGETDRAVGKGGAQPEQHKSKVQFEEGKRHSHSPKAGSNMAVHPAADVSEAPAASEQGGGGASRPPIKREGNTAGAGQEQKHLHCDNTADWARSENLALSLMRQKADPDEIFFPLPNQRTCELADIFSAPRRRERAQGSGEWSGPAATKLFKDAVAGTLSCFELVGLEGEYAGEVLALPLSLLSVGKKSVILGRSSACDVTLARDDQVSRKHLQIDVVDGKLMVQDLGST